MAALSDAELELIKRFSSHPRGMGYVGIFSDAKFSAWFRDEWNIDIDDAKYSRRGGSKGNRLVSFCRQESDATVLKVLKKLRDVEFDLNIRKSNVVDGRDIGSFENLIKRIELSLPTNPDEVVFANVTGRQVLSNVKANTESLMLVSATALESLAIFKKTIRSNNYLSATQPETCEDLLRSIDDIIAQLMRLFSILPPAPYSKEEPRDRFEGKVVVSWTQRYLNSALPKLQTYFSPEKLGEASAPASVILACGAVGALLTGLNPLGFGAGSMFGKWLAGEIKGEALADHIAQNITGEK